MSDNQRIIVILGMHRSGTSLATRGVQAFGASLGENLLLGDAHNPTGYWENAALVDLNDRLLAAQGLHWDAACVQPKRVLDQDAFHREGCELLRNLFGATWLIGVKDPRMMRLLWFWQPIFRELQLQTSYLLLVREPREVIASLQARSPGSASQAQFLWILHYLDALEDRDESTLVGLNYQDLMAAPATALRRVAAGLALDRSTVVDEAIENFVDFVDGKLWRQRGGSSGDQSDAVSQAATALYGALRAIARDEASLDSRELAGAVGKARELIAGVASVLELAAIANGQAWPRSSMEEPRWGARLNPRMPAVIEPGEAVRVEVVCKNEGTRRWTPTRPAGCRLNLSYHVRDHQGLVLERNGDRTPLRTSVGPGDQAVLLANFTAPAVPGDYFVEWDMVSEGECWFGDAGSLTATVPVRVSFPDEPVASRYPAEVMSAAQWSPRFRKAPGNVRAAIAVRTWNALEHGREAMLERTLESLRAAGYPFELILFDNGSTDGTADLVAARGGILGPRSVGNDSSGHGMNQAIELALASGSDLIVFSDDDIEWHPDFLAKLVRFWSNAPHDLILASGFVEPRLRHNAVRGTIDSGGVRALVRETAPGGAWSFPATHWRWIGPLQPGMEADWEACLRLRAAGFRLAQIDLATHLGVDRSTWGNMLPANQPISAELLLGNVPS